MTGRELPDLKLVFPQINIFDRVVAENGALIYSPQTEEEHAIASAPPAHFVEELNARGVSSLSVGRSIVATWEPFGSVVRDVIGEMGLDLEVISNKGAIMVLPAGVNKASGLVTALKELDILPCNVVGVGDPENDQALLSVCGFGAAVSNALPSLKKNADMLLHEERGAGVQELIRWILNGGGIEN